MNIRRQTGTAAVEFALVLPLLLLIIFGIIEFSLALYDKALITNASREAARYGVVLSSPKKTQTEIHQRAQKYYCSQVITFATTKCTDGGTDGDVTVVGAEGASGTQLSVTVKYTFTGLGLGSLLSALNAPLNFSSTTIMVHE